MVLDEKVIAKMHEALKTEKRARDMGFTTIKLKKGKKGEAVRRKSFDDYMALPVFKKKRKIPKELNI